jgi:hypothetical protein
LERKKQCQKKWLSKQENKNWFSGSENTQRVQEWRKKNPGYWKRDKKKKLLQDSVFSQVIEKDNVTKQEQQREKIMLQDFANSQLFLITGLISHITGEPLQDSVVRKMRHFIIKGQSLLDHKNEMKGVCNGEKIASSRSTA